MAVLMRLSLRRTRPSRLAVHAPIYRLQHATLCHAALFLFGVFALVVVHHYNAERTYTLTLLNGFENGMLLFYGTFNNTRN